MMRMSSLQDIAMLGVFRNGTPTMLITGDNNGIKISKLYTNDGIVSAIENGSEALRFEFTLSPNPS